MSEIILRDGATEILFLGERPWPLPSEGVWVFSDLVDWAGQTDDKVPQRERPQAHGAFDTDRSLRASRAPSFNARFVGNSLEQTERALEEMDAMGAEGPVEMIVTTPGRTTSRTVTVENVERTDRRSRQTGSVAVDLVARDPRRYDVDPQSATTGPATAGAGRVWPAVWPLVWPAGGSSGRITLTNTGKAPSAPTFILDGGFDTALITCLETGSRIGFNRQVPVGSSVVIDTANRTAMIDGQSDVSRWLRYREWEVIPPGASRTFQFDATGVIVTPGAPAEQRRNRFKNTLSGENVLGLTAVRGSLSSGADFTRLTITDALAVTAAQRFGFTGGDRVTVVPGEEFRVDVGVRTNSGATPGLMLYFYDGSGVLIGSMINGTPVAATGLTWVPATVSAAAPANAATAQVEIGLIGTGVRSVGGTLDARQITSAGMPWFNGSTAPSGDLSYAWAGPLAASESVEFRTTDTVTASLEGQVRSAWW